MSLRRVGLACCSGLLVSFSFPSWISPSLVPWTGWIAWFALVPLLFALENMRPARAALFGWLAGVVFFANTLYWIGAIRELEMWRVPALLALASVLGLYWALWSAGVAAGGARASILLAPAWWAITEILRGSLFSGFPWTPLGASQWAFPGLFVATRVGGVHAISACVVAANVGICAAVRQKGDWRKTTIVALLWVTGFWGLSLWQRSSPMPRGNAVTVSALQGNFTEEEKNSLPSSVMLDRFEQLALEAEEGAAVHVWPETATASDIRAAGGEIERIMRLSGRTGAPQLVGAIMGTSEGRYFNGAFMIGPDGIDGVYLKRHLVPFGEYIPGWFREFVPLARKLTVGLADFTRGRAASVIVTATGQRMGVLICYEALFAAEVRSLVVEGADILINMTNDAWYRRTAASAQHALGPIVKAVEFDRYVVRSANTGISLIVSPEGRILAELPLFATGTISARVTPVAGLTWYARWGEGPLLMLFLCAVGFAALLRQGRGRSALPS